MRSSLDSVGKEVFTRVVSEIVDAASRSFGVAVPLEDAEPCSGSECFSMVDTARDFGRAQTEAERYDDLGKVVVIEGFIGNHCYISHHPNSPLFARVTTHSTAWWRRLTSLPYPYTAIKVQPNIGRSPATQCYHAKLYVVACIKVG